MTYRRHYHDWLASYVDYAGFSEAPRRMHFWAGVSAVAGALRRRVWLDMAYFRWHVNHYIIFVAPPGIVSKSTTVAIAIDILRKVPGVIFGPDVVTWEALVKAFEEATESFELNQEWHTQCALTIESSEFGNLVDPTNREMIDLLVTLWDSKQGAFKKVTKNSGSDTVENPWINMVACTTPSWIAGNFPEYVIGGGFTSRCLFVYTEQKEKLVAYPSLSVPKDLKRNQELLLEDLIHISTNLVGPYELSDSAVKWGREWYDHHYSKSANDHLSDERFSGYLARKQTHLHKLGMVIAAACRDEKVVLEEDLSMANTMITDLEKDMPKVFSRIGRSQESIQAERFVNFIKSKGAVPYSEAYAYIHSHFPNLRDFEGVLNGAVRAGLITMTNSPGGFLLSAIQGKSDAS